MQISIIRWINLYQLLFHLLIVYWNIFDQGPGIIWLPYRYNLTEYKLYLGVNADNLSFVQDRDIF